MPIIIPSKKIYYIENNKILGNVIKGTVGYETTISTKRKVLKEFSFSPNFEESARFFLNNYLQYSQNSLKTDGSGSSVTGGSIYNSVFCYNVDFNINSNEYIDINNIYASVELKYKYGESYNGSVARPALKSNSRLTNLFSKKETGIVRSGQSGYLIVPPRNMAQAGYFYTQLKYANGVDRPTELKISIVIPSYYNNQYTQDTNTVDSFVVTDIKISIFADVYDFETTSNLTYGDTPQKELQSNELFQNQTEIEGKTPFLYLSENVVSNYMNGKETAKIRCSISDYKNEYGNIVISPNLMNLNVENISTSATITKSSLGLSTYIVPENMAKKWEYFSYFDLYHFGLKKIILDSKSGAHGTIKVSLSQDVNDESKTLVTMDLMNEGVQEREIGFIDPSDVSPIRFYLHYLPSEEKTNGFNFSFDIFGASTNISFKIGDSVIPMKKNGAGEDVPISKKEDDTPKSFKVIGKKMIYDGAVWQELTLQEE